MERFFRNPHTIQQKRLGPLDAYIDDFAELAQVIESVRHLALPISRKRAKLMTSALRAFLRYAGYQDLIRSNLAASSLGVRGRTKIPRAGVLSLYA